MNGWQSSGASPADDLFVSAADRAADMTLVWSLLDQYYRNFKGQVNILKKEKYICDFLGLQHCATSSSAIWLDR